ncbi:hypothetical protein LUZ60_016045 [Juncus effusus]|nr:hypothetical protein LUZ60_016045 [Juncus effusus]
MAQYNRYDSYNHQNYAPSAPPMPSSSNYQQQQQGGNRYDSYPRPQSQQGGYYSSPPAQPQPQPQQGGYYSSPPAQPQPQQGGYNNYFPPGTNPEVIRCFQAVDRDGSGSIDERELQLALSSGYHSFSIRTVRLLLFLFKNPRGPSDRIGPGEFAVLWNCLGQWRGIFDRFDRDRSGKIDMNELSEALRSLGYAVPPSVIQILISNYTDGFSSRGALDFDNFVECGMIAKGITDKFKEMDKGYTGSATFTYESFLSTIIPFVVP